MPMSVEAQASNNIISIIIMISIIIIIISRLHRNGGKVKSQPEPHSL